MFFTLWVSTGARVLRNGEFGVRELCKLRSAIGSRERSYDTTIEYHTVEGALLDSTTPPPPNW